MSTGQYTAADVAPQQQGQYSAADVQPQPKSWLDQLSDVPKGIWNNLTQSGQGLIDAGKAAFDTLAHPVDTATGKTGVTKLAADMGNAQDAVRLKAEAAFQRGDYAEGVRHVISYLIPAIGPQIDASGDKAQQGKWGEAAGEAIGTASQLAAPDALSGVSIPVRGIPNPNPTEAAALDYLQNKNVPVSAAARTGNAFVKNAQKAVDSTPLGAVVAAGAQKATTGALQAEAGNLAARANPAPVMPEQAGAGVRAALDARVQKFAQDADTAYSQFRTIEAQPQNLKTITVGTKQVPTGVVDAQGNPTMRTQPITEQIALPVDVSGIKAKLQPIFDDMQTWWEPAKRNASAGYQAAKSILDGPDVVPASQAEAGLGGLKQLAREGAGRNAGIAKLITPQLQDAIDSSVKAQGGQNALYALQAGRASTAAQYGVQGVVDQLRAEPVQTFGQMTYAKDAGIGLLREVQKQAPAELPRVGRAYLEDMFGKAQAQGEWTGADGIFAKWQQLGPQTKQLLFGNNPQLVSDLDKFFLGAKKLAENPNPSGTTVLGLSAGSGALVFTHPQTGIPLALGAGAVSKLLHSPAGVQLLTKGMNVPLKGPGAALLAGQILRAAGSDLQPLPGAQPTQPQPLPKAAQNAQLQQTALATSSPVRP